VAEESKRPKSPNRGMEHNIHGMHGTAKGHKTDDAGEMHENHQMGMARHPDKSSNTVADMKAIKPRILKDDS